METASAPNVAKSKSGRRWWQFSLRTLLIGVVVLSLPLGWLARQVQIIRYRHALAIPVTSLIDGKSK
jgi:hypothetical protein